MVAEVNGNESPPPPKGDYYNSGSSEPAETSELVLNRLEAVCGDDCSFIHLLDNLPQILL